MNLGHATYLPCSGNHFARGDPKIGLVGAFPLRYVLACTHPGSTSLLVGAIPNVGVAGDRVCWWSVSLLVYSYLSYLAFIAVVGYISLILPPSPLPSPTPGLA